jgi:autophagy-related protein 2
MDWALKRVLRFALKKNVGRFLRVELDAEQLDVFASAGRVEVRDVLLNSEALNAQLVRPAARARGRWGG